MMTSEEILKFMQDNKAEMAERFGVTRLGLAGSAARGEMVPGSDVDVIVSLDSSNLFRSFFGLLHYLQDALPHKVDLATETSLKPLVRAQIMKDIRYV
ncbi:MAG: nucleotidyltransferase family protein [Desulfuromonadales bacterium]|nr:nucleotidyltransferase family protein [Desulfuromonadales bacterium]